MVLIILRNTRPRYSLFCNSFERWHEQVLLRYEENCVFMCILPHAYMQHPSACVLKLFALREAHSQTVKKDNFNFTLLIIKFKHRFSDVPLIFLTYFLFLKKIH